MKLDKKIALSIMFATSTLLSGCSNDIDAVKSGILEFNKTITVGEAFDNWDSCVNSQWELFETSNGTKVVQFICNKKDVKEYMDKVKALLSEKQLASFSASGLNITENKQTFQFTINKDDTFQIDNVQVETVWADGKSFQDSQQSMEELERVYANEVSWDINELNNVVAQKIAYLFTILEAQAK